MMTAITRILMDAHGIVQLSFSGCAKTEQPFHQIDVRSLVVMLRIMALSHVTMEMCGRVMDVTRNVWLSQDGHVLEELHGRQTLAKRSVMMVGTLDNSNATMATMLTEMVVMLHVVLRKDIIV